MFRFGFFSYIYPIKIYAMKTERKEILTQLELLLKTHDWNYVRSNVGTVFNKGLHEERTIDEFLRMLGLTRSCDLYKKYSFVYNETEKPRISMFKRGDIVMFNCNYEGKHFHGIGEIYSILSNIKDNTQYETNFIHPLVLSKSASTPPSKFEVESAHLSKLPKAFTSPCVLQESGWVLLEGAEKHGYKVGSYSEWKQFLETIK